MPNTRTGNCCRAKAVLGAEAMQSRRSALVGRYQTSRSFRTAARLPPLLSWHFDSKKFK
jgi:hypothetical protein